MAAHTYEFLRVVDTEIVSTDPDVKRLGIQRLYVLMTGEPALDEATAVATIKGLCTAILAALDAKEDA